MLLFAIPKFVCSHEIGSCSLLVWKSPNFLNHYCKSHYDQEEKSAREKNLILEIPLRTIVDQYITTIEFNKLGIMILYFSMKCFTITSIDQMCQFKL